MKELFGIRIDEEDAIFLSDMEEIADGIKKAVAFVSQHDNAKKKQ